MRPLVILEPEVVFQSSPGLNGVGDGHCLLGGKQDECVFVFGRELPAALLLGEIDVADGFAR